MNIDADIVYGTSRAEGVVAVPLGVETILRCARRRSPRRSVDRGSDRRPSDPERPQASALVRLVRANGQEPVIPHGARFDRSFLAIAAAADGLGVALESTRLAERELAGGRIVAPLAGKARDVEYTGHYLVFPRAARQRRAVRLFTDWLVAELGLPPAP